MSDRYKFNIVDGSVTQVFEFDDGAWKQETIEADTQFVVDGSAVLKIENDDDGSQDVDRYEDANGDGIYEKASESRFQGDDDVLTGTNGRDDQRGGRGNDSFFGRGGNDRFLGEQGNDRLRGDTGEDDLDGGVGDDDLDGGKGRDDLKGDLGRDALQGGDDADRLRGGAQADTSSGGRGADRFLFGSTSDSGVGRGNRDRITDFRANEGDVVDLSGIDADTLRSGNQAFRYIAGQTFHAQAGELRLDQGLLQADINGDRRADFEIELPGVTRLDGPQVLL